MVSLDPIIIKRGDVLLLDIEGTICPITFVTNVLFPYVRNNLRMCLEHKWAQFEDDVDSIRQLTAQEISSGDSTLMPVPFEKNENLHKIIDAVCNNVGMWMDRDKKFTALKKLQGDIFKEAFRGGHIKSNFYPDVIPFLTELQKRDVKVYIYSSGSVDAQKLLFGHTNIGDISNLVSGNFDTTIGLKTEASSYQKISEKIGVKPEQILFLTDVEREAYPAVEMGLHCLLVVRDGNEALSEKARQDFKLVKNFDEITF